MNPPPQLPRRCDGLIGGSWSKRALTVEASCLPPFWIMVRYFSVALGVISTYFPFEELGW